MNSTQLKIFIGISRARKKIGAKSNKLFLKYGLTEPQFGVLEAIYHKGPLSVGEIQEKILSSSGTIPVIIKNLEKRGLLTKEKDKLDKRKFIIRITDDGSKLMDEVFPQNKEIICNEIDRSLSKDEQETLVRLLKKM
ncbi:MarR family winged helix-turn-helix transcriptional regulator [Peptostreptococcus russellii]|uniref:Transcriptional regulator, MarR family n=1 Tax=Peptostreptococcus russellii TaxID=215200 RepID=A0A1H8I952_9FIRM|nr:MarR family transcriptional regulator [Peptostreptococcus russellii]SEN65273.1 transcriptional regulator, MarR family [Peptostreptococcus russellii]